MSKPSVDSIVGAIVLGSIIQVFFRCLGAAIRFAIQHPIISTLLVGSIVGFHWLKMELGFNQIDVPALMAMNERQLDEEYGVVDCSPNYCMYDDDRLEASFQDGVIQSITMSARYYKTFRFDAAYHDGVMTHLHISGKVIHQDLDSMVYETPEFIVSMTSNDDMRPSLIRVHRKVAP